MFPKEDIGSSKNETGTSQDYFNLKEPANKGELLAVAARFLEKSENTESCKRDQIKKAILDSRRNFDAANFLRDMKNATSQAGFFNKGGSNGEYALSYFGQQFVDALPDRVAAKAIKRPGTKKKPAAKKKAK